MRIALFPSAFYPSLGGVEELTRQLAHELKRQGHQVLILTERWPRNLPKAESHESLEIRRFPMRVPTEHWKSRLSFFLTHQSIRAAIVAELRRFRPDVLHVQCVSSTTLYALHARKVLGKPLVVTLQGELTMDAAGIFQKPGIAQKIMRMALAEAEAITGCSLHTLKEAEDFWGHALLGRGRVIYNGMRFEDFADVKPSRHSRPFALAIGRHVHQKGFDILLQAWQQTGDLGLDLVLAGEGPERAKLEQLAAQLNIQKRVTFVGRTDRIQTVALFKGCDFFILPSRHEPFGIVNLEAMAAGKAVIATRVGGVPEVVTDTTGIIIESESVSSLSEAITLLASDASLRQRLGDAGKERAAAFAWKVVTREYLQSYHESHK